MAAEPIFLDTNVLVHVSRPGIAEHKRARAALGRLEAEGGELWISRQVLREYLAAVTRPQATAPSLPMATAITDVRQFQSAFSIAEDGGAVLDRLLTLLELFPSAGKHVHDANVVATMLTHGLRRLLTFNTADFQRFAELIALEPLPL
jgi:predicted nucleic acid-binding protein